MEMSRADQDREDVASVLAGDSEAFAGIVHRWQGPLVNLAYRFCRDRRVAEEMAQDAFLRAFANLAAFDVEFDDALKAACEAAWWSLPRRPVQEGYR